MSIFDILLSASARRQKRFDDLVVQREAVQAEYTAAIAADTDVDKLDAKLRKLDAEIVSVRTAIDATAAEKRRQEQVAAAARGDRAAETARIAFANYVREATEAARLAIAFGEQWRAVEEAAALALAAERRVSEAGLSLRTLTGRHTGPSAVWQRVFMLLLRTLKKHGDLPMHFPTLPARPGVESVESWLTRELASHAPYQENVK